MSETRSPLRFQARPTATIHTDNSRVMKKYAGKQLPHATRALKLSSLLRANRTLKTTDLHASLRQHRRRRRHTCSRDLATGRRAICSTQPLRRNRTSSQVEIAKLLMQKSPVRYSLSVDIVRKEVPAYNVIGVLEGSDPVLKNETIVIGAHYDHLGRGGEGSGSLAPSSGEIHHGADDNASGTAGLLELARIFMHNDRRPKRTMVFIAFGGEEEGLLGSNLLRQSSADCRSPTPSR